MPTGEIKNRGEGEFAELSSVQAENTERFIRLRQLGAFCGRTALRLGLIGLFSIGAVKAFGTTTGEVGPLTFEASPALNIPGNNSGDAVVNAGAGEVSIDYSDGLYGMNIDLKEISADALSEVQHITNRAANNNQNPVDALVKEYKPEAIDLVTYSFIKGGLIALVGAGIGGLNAELLIRELRRRNNYPYKNHLVRNVGLGPAILLLATTLNVATYDENALASPSFNRDDALGALVALGQNTFQSLDDYNQESDRATTAFENFIEIEKNLGIVESTPDNLIPFLIMSDRHSKPCTYDRVEALAKAYNAVAVLNAGDETEWGYSLEFSVFNDSCPDSNPGQLDIPIYFVDGNHDSAYVLEEMKKYKNVINLDGTVVEAKFEYKGKVTTFTIMGDNDPAYLPDSTDPEQNEDWKVKEEKLGEQLARIAQNTKPDLLIVHDPRAIAKIREILGNEQKIILFSGHSHKFKLEQDKNLIWVSVPSIGASGLRGYEGEESSNIEGSLIAYINRDTKQLEKITRTYLDNLGRYCSDDIYLKNPPPKALQQLSCAVN